MPRPLLPLLPPPLPAGIPHQLGAPKDGRFPFILRTFIIIFSIYFSKILELHGTAIKFAQKAFPVIAMRYLAQFLKNVHNFPFYVSPFGTAICLT